MISSASLDSIVSKYPITNSEWEWQSCNGVKLGSYIKNTFNIIFNESVNMYNNDYKYFDDYYVRSFVVTAEKVRGGANDLAPYDRDPWFRKFPQYMSNTKKINFVKNQVKYGYDCIYRNKVKINAPLGDIVQSVPLAILYYSSVDGKNIHCLDLIKR